MSEDLGRVAVLSLGGTVAMTRESTGGATPTLDAAGLVDAVAGIERRAQVVAESLSATPGASLRLVDLWSFVHRMETLCADGVRGVVVTTGTDTLEEVAYAYDLVWQREEPLVITGAMRTADSPGSDGPANVLAAVTVAASPQARGRGVLVVLNDDIHSARAVRKAHTTRLDAFESAGAASVGRVHEGQVHLMPAGVRPPALRLPPDVTAAPKVALLRLTLDQDVTLLEHAAETHDGVVIEALGAGHVPAWWVDAIRSAHLRVPVVVTSRTGNGRLLRSCYGFPGSERDLVELGLSLMDDMDGTKARILLTTALLTAPDRAGVADIMSMRAREWASLSDRIPS